MPHLRVAYTVPLYQIRGEQYGQIAMDCIFKLTLCVFVFYIDDRSDDITGAVNDSVDTNLNSPCNCQPANSDNDSAFKTPTAKLSLKNKGKLQLVI